MTDPATEYAAATHRVRQALLAAEARKHPPETGIDDDPRNPDQQADDFFTRPGDFHQVRIEVPEATNAECVIKFTPDQKPLIVEVLRQIRGTLAARITLTPAQPTDDCTITAATWLPGDPVCPINGEPCHCDRTPNSCPHTSNRLTPIPMTNGKTAHAITPPPRPTAGRHAKPGHNQHTDYHDDVRPARDEAATQLLRTDPEKYFRQFHPRGK